MGTYTGLRGSVTLKDNVADAVKAYKELEQKSSEPYIELWEYVREVTGLDLQGFDEDYRADFIPFGAVCYMPEDWVYGNEIEGNVLTFTCSLKNYTGTIGKFIDILPVIATAWNLEELHEEASEPVFYVSKGE